MIASLRGELQHKSQDRVIVDVGGVGYEVLLSLNSIEQLPGVGERIFLHIHTQVREDAITLFGFVDTEEKRMFKLLINVNGIGPRLALAILSGVRPAALARAIGEHNIKLLTGLSGVGKKTAERLCLDLKDKVALMGGYETGGPAMGSEPLEQSVAGDVVSALVNLGYPLNSAQQAIGRVKKRLSPEVFEAMKLQELLRETLRSLA